MTLAETTVEFSTLQGILSRATLMQDWAVASVSLLTRETAEGGRVSLAQVRSTVANSGKTKPVEEE